MRTVTIACPCCELASLVVTLAWEDTEGSRPSWDLDDYDPSCDCHDYIQRLPKSRTNGVLIDVATAKYHDDIFERAVEEVS